jgi:hypothetical protein
MGFRKVFSMIIICEDCGKKYRLDPFKLQGRSARFKCRACDHLIQLPAPEQIKEMSRNGSWESKQTSSNASAEVDLVGVGEKGISEKFAPTAGKMRNSRDRMRRGLRKTIRRDQARKHRCRSKRCRFLPDTACVLK